MEIFNEKKFTNIRGEIKDATEVLNDKIFGLYFSAGWCPPCRVFTEVLHNVYTELKKRHAPFEVVFVSFDKTKADMEAYVKELHGDWWMVHYNGPTREELQAHFEVEMVPKLLVLSPTGTILTRKGRKEVEDRGVSALRNWLTAAGVPLARVRTPDFIQESMLQSITDKGEPMKKEEIPAEQ